MSNSSNNPIKGDSRPQDYKALYLELLDVMENIGFSLQVQSKNTKNQALNNIKAREELLRQEQEEKEKNAQQEEDTLPSPETHV